MHTSVEEFHENIEHATQYCDIRDLLAGWRHHAGAGPVDAALLRAEFPHFADRLMNLVDKGGDLVYDQIGRSVSAILSHLVPGLKLSGIDNPSIHLFASRYWRTLADGRPSLCIQQHTGSSAMGVNERLILPVSIAGRRGLLIYLRAREDENELLRAVFHASSDSITVIKAIRNEGGRIVDFRTIAANAEAARRLGMTVDSLIGMLLMSKFPFAEEVGALDRFAKAIETQKADAIELSYVLDGRPIDRRFRFMPWGECLTVTGVDIGPEILARRAIEQKHSELLGAHSLLERRAIDLKASNDALQRTTIELREEIRRNKVLELELIYLAQHDGLTGAPNRSYFESRFEEALAEAARDGTRLVLCVVDIDRFKEINDRFGHAGGDEVLREVSRRLASVVGDRGSVGRMGGDEFAVIVTGQRDARAIAEKVENLVRSGMAPFKIERRDVPIGLSVGVAVYPEDGQTARELAAAADMAVYRAKRDGRGRPVFFEPALRLQAERIYRLIGRIGGAIERGEIFPHYQPLLDLRTGQIVGFEALARWRHPERGLISPVHFAEALEVPDIAQAMTRRMIDAIISDVRAWTDQPIPAHISVNVTSFDLRQPDFASVVSRKLAANGLSSRQLAIEVTETTVLSRDADRIAETLGALQALGFSIALDDFGTGFASLSHLLKLPVNSLKIDRSFVADIETSAKTAALVRSLVSLAGSLGLDIVAEGVETREQLDRLRALGCHLVQGFLISEPLPASEVLQFTRNFASEQPDRRLSARRAL